MKQILKEKEIKDADNESLKYEREYIFFTTRIYRSLHNKTFVIDEKTEKVNDRSTLDRKKSMLKSRYKSNSSKNTRIICYFSSKEKESNC